MGLYVDSLMPSPVGCSFIHEIEDRGMFCLQYEMFARGDIKNIYLIFHIVLRCGIP